MVVGRFLSLENKAAYLWIDIMTVFGMYVCIYVYRKLRVLNTSIASTVSNKLGEKAVKERGNGDSMVDKVSACSQERRQ